MNDNKKAAAYRATPFTFFTPSIPFIESRLSQEANSTSQILLRLLRVSWWAATLPLHLLLVTFNVFLGVPIPFRIGVGGTHRQKWSKTQHYIYPLTSRFIWALTSTGGDFNGIPFGFEEWAIKGYRRLTWLGHDTSDVTVTSVAIAPPKDGAWFQGPAHDHQKRVVPEIARGEWIEPIEEKDSDFVMLYFAGGGYVAPEPTNGAFMQAKAARIKVLDIWYRKATSSSKAFPAALQDAIAGYSYLVSKGYKNIILSGDSAGAALCLSLTIYITTILHHSASRPPSLTLPRAFVLFSPWPDMTLSSLPPPETQHDDLLNYTQISAAVRSYLANDLIAASDPLVSQALESSFPTLKRMHELYSTLELPLPKYLITYGEIELFSAQIRALALNLRRSHEGVEVTVEGYEDEPHAFLLAPRWLSPKGDDVMAKSKEFLDALREKATYVRPPLRL